MDNTGGAERDWTKQYRLAAGVYAMRGGQILMLERARGMMTGFWSVPGGIVDPGETPQAPIRLSVRRWRRAAQSRALRLEVD